MFDLPVLEISGEPDNSICIDTLQDILKVFCKMTGFGEKTEVSLVFCRPEEMLQINRRYRGVDKSTDVISFQADGLPIGMALDNEETAYLGEILVDTNYIAAHPNTGILNEDVGRVFLHGLLHLAGYDHQNESKAMEMNEMETQIRLRIKQEGLCE
jgi:probable rRNA maturation factor